MTEKSNTVDGVSADYDEVYDPSQNKEDWGFSDLDGTDASQKAETSELHKSIFVPHGAKTIEIYHEKFGTLWALRFVEGGKIPDDLKGKYTNPEDAKLAADIYIAQQD